MPINATCDFHSATTRRNFQSAIRNRAILLDYDLSREAIGCILRSETLTLRQRDRNPQDIVICGGCYNRLRKGETDFFPVFYRTELKWISRKGENRRVSSRRAADSLKLFVAYQTISFEFLLFERTIRLNSAF